VPATRRGVLAGAGLAGLAGVVSACAPGGASSSAAGAPPITSTPAAPAATAASSASRASGGALTTTSEIPVGGGTIFATEKVVVTQPNSGDFKCFSAICTHMPAPRPLPPEAIKVSGDSIFLG
jgi:hypothetical protein